MFAINFCSSSLQLYCGDSADGESCKIFEPLLLSQNLRFPLQQLIPHQLLLHILKSEAFDRICKPLARLSLLALKKDCFFDDIQCLFFIGKNFA